MYEFFGALQALYYIAFTIIRAAKDGKALSQCSIDMLRWLHVEELLILITTVNS